MKKETIIAQDTGIVRLIDELGRVVIPKILRKEIGIKEGDAIDFFFDAENKTICLKKYNPLI